MNRLILKSSFVCRDAMCTRYVVSEKKLALFSKKHPNFFSVSTLYENSEMWRVDIFYTFLFGGIAPNPSGRTSNSSDIVMPK